MAWVFPMTFTVGSMVGHATLNVQLRDQLAQLGTHNHLGPQFSGYGHWILAGIIWIDFAAAAAPGTPTVDITRLFATGTTLGIRSTAGAVVILSDSTHTHSGF